MLSNSLNVSRRQFFGIAAAMGLACAFGSTMAFADDAAKMEGEISVYSREDGSGTRGAFIELFGIEQKDADGNKVDMTTDMAMITNSTAVMMTTVAGDEQGIGYISLGSVNDTVKALKIDDVEATVENVKAGTYKIVRPFNIITNGELDKLDEVSADFVNYILSADGQKVIEDNGYIAAVEQGFYSERGLDVFGSGLFTAAPYETAGVSGKVVVAGSSSVTPVMEKLAEAYKALNADTTVEVQQSDSSTGVSMAIEGTCNIGMASREIKDSEAEKGAVATVIARDGIAVIVCPDAPIDGLTTAQVRAIYTGEVETWEDALAYVDPEADKAEGDKAAGAKADDKAADKASK